MCSKAPARLISSAQQISFPTPFTLFTSQSFTFPQISIRNLPGGKGRPARKADNLTAICEPIV
jgi:hypothetical protein